MIVADRRNLKSLLERGALLTAANWPVVLIQFIADALIKLLVGIPIVGGLVLLVLVVGQEIPGPGSFRDVGVAVMSALATHPVGLAGFAASLAIVVTGASALTFVVKAGSVAVLAASHDRLGPIEQGPTRWRDFRNAQTATPEAFLDGCARLWRRFLVLGFLLLGGYALSFTLYLLVVVEGLSPPDAEPIPAHVPVAAALAAAALVACLTLVNLYYLLIQMVMAADDVGIRIAAGRVGAYVRRDGRTVAGLFIVMLSLVIVGTAASIVTAAALGLISFVPLVGFAVFPLQAVAWLVRGLVFQFIGLAGLGSYLSLYRDAP